MRLVDAEEALAAASPHGAPGSEAFLDHVHLTFHGKYLLGEALLEEVREAPAGRGPTAAAQAGPCPTRETSTRGLVYTELDRYRIAETMQQRLRDAPFTNQPDHAEHAKRFADEIALLRARGDLGAVDAARHGSTQQALASGRAHWSVRERYAAIEKRVGNAAAAAEQWEILAKQLPQYPAFQLQLSRALRDTGRFAEARAALQKVLDYQPDAPVTLVEAGAARARAGPLRGRASAARARGVARPARRERADRPGREPVPAPLVRATGAGGGDRLAQRALEIAPESDTVSRDLAALRGK